MSDDDELPAISVNSSASSSGLFNMPSAAEVAGARDRTAQCERELAQLRAVVVPPHSDSSGSEGEAALAAAVSHLCVAAAAPPAPARSLPAILARALAAGPCPQSPLLERYLAAAATAAPAQLAVLDRRVAATLTTGVPDEETAGAALWAAAACGVPSDPRLRPCLLRLAHMLLERLDRGTTEHVCVALEAGLAECGSPRVEVVDALRGGGPTARHVAARLSALAPAHDTDRYAALQLTGRAPLPDADAARRLLDSLAPRHPHPTPEQLKMLVAASKIRVLFDIGR